MRARVDHGAVIDGLHADLMARFEQIRNGDEWIAYLTAARRFHRYSPNNQLLLALQGAEGYVASYRNWQRIPAQGGGPCQVAKGAKGLAILAPLIGKAADIDDSTGEETTRQRLYGFRTVKVFHQGQLVAPPDIPAPQLPELLQGEDRWQRCWVAVVNELTADGFKVDLGARTSVDKWNGRTDYDTRTVTVLDDLAPPQRLKTLLHEWAHVQLDHEGRRDLVREMREIEAESVAFILAGTLGLDSSRYSIPYICGWSGGEPELLAQTAERVLATSKQLVATLEQELGLDLTPDVLDHAPSANVTQLRPERDTAPPTEPAVEPDPPAHELGVAGGEPVAAFEQQPLEGIGHLQQMRRALVDPPLTSLAAFVRELEAEPKAEMLDLLFRDGAAPQQARHLAAAGFSAIQIAQFLNRQEYPSSAIEAAIAAPVDDHERPNLFPDSEVRTAIEQLAPPPGRNLVQDPVDTPDAQDERELAGTFIMRAHRRGEPPGQIASLAAGFGAAPAQVVDLFRSAGVNPRIAAEVLLEMHNGNTLLAVNDLSQAWPDPPGGWGSHIHPAITQHRASDPQARTDSIEATLNRWGGIPTHQPQYLSITSP